MFLLPSLSSPFCFIWEEILNSDPALETKLSQVIYHVGRFLQVPCARSSSVSILTALEVCGCPSDLPGVSIAYSTQTLLTLALNAFLDKIPAPATGFQEVCGKWN